MRTMATSPVVLEGYLGFTGALANGRLSPLIRAQVALAVAEANRCDYCLSAHTVLGKQAGLSEDAIVAAREGQADDPKAKAAVQLARLIVSRRGQVSDAEVANARRAGLSEGELAEIVAAVAINIFTNYLNLVASTEIDFPLAQPLAIGAA
jgi:AhpD family alkylhydroperoxidase